MGTASTTAGYSIPRIDSSSSNARQLVDMKTRKGVLTAAMAFLAASVIVSGLGLTLAVNTALETFSNIGQESDRKFLREMIVSNMKSACKPDRNTNINIPRHGTFKRTLEGVDKINIDQYKNTWGDKVWNLRLDYGSYRRVIRIDKDGHLSSPACEGGNWTGLYQLNSTTFQPHGGDGFAGPRSHGHGYWLNVDGSKPIKFRIMTEQGGKYVNLQVTQN